MLTPEEREEIEAEFAHYPNKKAVCIDAMKIVQTAPRVGVGRKRSRTSLSCWGCRRRPGWRRHVLQPDFSPARWAAT